MNRPFLKPKEREKKWECYFVYEWSKQLLYSKDQLNELIPGLEACYAYCLKNTKFMIPLLDICNALILKDKDSFHKHLKKHLDEYLKKIGKDVEPDISFGALEHCHTAMLLGMEVEIDHQFLPKELLLKPEYIREAYTKTGLVTEIEEI